MQTSSIVNRQFRQEKIGDTRPRAAGRARCSKLGMWCRSENVVAAFSLAVLVTTVLDLLRAEGIGRRRLTRLEGIARDIHMIVRSGTSGIDGRGLTRQRAQFSVHGCA